MCLVWPPEIKGCKEETAGQKGVKDKRNNTGEGTTGETKRQTLRVQPSAVLPAARPAEVKFTGSCRQYSEPGLHRRFGGACMHKTDGKLFCVAAPIPGAGAGGKGGRRSTRWEAAQGKPNAPR